MARTRFVVSDMFPENMLSTIEPSIEKGSPDDDLQFLTLYKNYALAGTGKHETLPDFVKQLCEQWGMVRRFELTVVMEDEGDSEIKFKGADKHE